MRPGIKSTFIETSNMKKTIWLWLILISFSYGYSQTVTQETAKATLNFCTAVDPTTGYCNFNNTKFITSPDSTSGKIFMEVKGLGNTPINATSLILKIYRVNGAGEEKFVNLMQQSINAGWFYAWVPYYFDSPAKFVIKVYNESDQLMCTKGFELIAFSK